jgi:hypothetical protein
MVNVIRFFVLTEALEVLTLVFISSQYGFPFIKPSFAFKLSLVQKVQKALKKY